jgi:hypothetical protein
LESRSLTVKDRVRATALAPVPRLKQGCFTIALLATLHMLSSTAQAQPARASGVDLLLEATPDGIEIVAYRSRHATLPTPAIRPRSEMTGLFLEVVSPAGPVVERVNLGDPFLLLFDDLTGAEPALGLASTESRWLRIPLDTSSELAPELRILDPHGELWDSVALRELSDLRPRNGRHQSQTISAPEPVFIAGDSAERLDLLFMADGYREQEWPLFRAHVATCTEALLTAEPFATYPSAINIWQLPLRSAESGADHPCEGIQRQTRLDATYDWPACRTRMMSYNYLAAWLVATEALPDWDHLIVLVNDPERAGAMPPFAPGPIYGAHDDLRYLTIHEWIGHGLASLMDEYDATDDVGPIGLPYAPNCSASRLFPPWQHWIRAGEPGVGTFKNCSFNNLYRPTANACIMRESGIYSFDPFCRERAVKGLFKVVRPILNATPDSGEPLPLSPGETIEFSVEALEAVDHHPLFTWLLDGEVLAEGYLPWFELDAEILVPGIHSFTVKVHDPTPLVRKDRRHLLDDARTWEVHRL